MSRSSGVDLVTGEGLEEALAGAECVVDAASSPTPDQQEATEFFTAATRNLQEAGERAAVRRIVVVSIIGCDRFSAGYIAAKVAHERAMLSGPIPVRILRAAQFHEFVEQFLEWGKQGDVSYVPAMRTQLVAARTVAETVVDVLGGAEIDEVAGPRPERLVDVARLLGNAEEVSDPDDPDRDLFATDGLLPGPGARLAGPTFEEWLNGRK
jgi:NAD(P)H-binding